MFGWFIGAPVWFTYIAIGVFAFVALLGVSLEIWNYYHDGC